MSLILLYSGGVMLFFNVAHQLVLMRFEPESFSLQQKILLVELIRTNKIMRN